MIDAEIKYIKVIPTNWMVKRIKESFDIKDELREPITADQRSQENPIYDYYGASGVIDKIDYFNVNDKVLLIGEDGANLVSRNLPLIYKAEGKFWVNNHAHILKPYKNKYDYNYCTYALEATDYTVFITGSAQPKLNQLNLGRVLIPFPPFCEQQAIANYLDTKCCKIDASIATLKEMKDKYLSLKKSLINETVCRGLNKNVPLKSSGIDWIGDIPQHWKVKRMKSLFEEKKDLSETGKEDLLSVSEYYGVAKRVDKMTDDDIYESRADTLVGYKLCQKGDLVVNIMLAWKKGLGISDFNGIVSPAYAVFKSKKLEPHYYHYLLRSDKYIAEFRRHSKGIIDSRWRLYPERFYNIIAITPPISEQQSIAKYLDDECSKIDSIVANINSQIEAYTKLKKSLISEVVTGKKRVI